MHLEAAPVDPVVVSDDQLGELDVLPSDGLKGPVQLPDDETEALKRPGFELVQLVMELAASLEHRARTVPPRRTPPSRARGSRPLPPPSWLDVRGSFRSGRALRQGWQDGRVYSAPPDASPYRPFARQEAEDRGRRRSWRITAARSPC